LGKVFTDREEKRKKERERERERDITKLYN